MRILVFYIVVSLCGTPLAAQNTDQLRGELRAQFGENWRPGYELWTSDLTMLPSSDPNDLAQCNALYEELFDQLVSQYGANVKTISLRHTADAIRLGCEVSRLRSAIPALRQSASSLREGAASLDQQFTLANSIAPEKFPAISGHDDSQVRMRRDALANEAAIASLEADIARLSALSRRAQELALQEDQTIISAMDPKAQLELLKALLGGTALS